MALVTANGLTAYDFQMRRPRVGAWHSDMLVESSEELTGQVRIVVDDGYKTFVGTAVRHGEFAETAHLRVVAGAGGLGVTASPKHYNNASVRVILGDLLRAAGESLSPSASASVLATQVSAWTTPALPVGAVIAALVEAVAPGTAWRMLPDGTFWIGSESWPGAGLDASTYQIMDEPFEEGSILIHVDRPAQIDPGSTFEGRHVSYVQDDAPQVAPVSSRVWFEDATTSKLGRLRESLAAVVNATRPAFDYRAMYWARVVTQSGNTVDVLPEAPGVPDMGGVRLVNPAGESVNGVVGGRVLVGWSWPELAPYAIAFDGSEATVAEKVIAALQVYLGAKAGAMPVLLLDPPTIAWFAAVGTGSGAGPMPQTALSLLVRAK
jgi:hypothetical protein